MKDAAPWAIHVAHLWRRAANQIRYPFVASAVELRAGGRIMSGPFRGLRAPHSGISWTHYIQMLGLYEKSLVPAIEAVVARQPAVIVDVGSHWGYYALGLAMRCPRSRVVAYEMDRSRAQLPQRYGRLNGLERRLEVRGVCTIEELAADLAGLKGAFLLMDVEGAEDTLLDPVRVPGLRHTEIIVELHDSMVPGVTERLRAAFASTHQEVLLQYENASIETVMTGSMIKHRLFRNVINRLMDERRASLMCWLYLKPNEQLTPTVP